MSLRHAIDIAKASHVNGSLRPRDAASIAAVHVAAWGEAYKKLMPAREIEKRSKSYRQQYWNRTLSSCDESGMRVLVAERDHEVVGFVAYGDSRDRPDSGRSEIYALYVSPGHWRSGIGRQLMDSASRYLMESGAQFIDCWVLATNRRALKFYEELGGLVTQSRSQEYDQLRVTWGIEQGD